VLYNFNNQDSAQLFCLGTREGIYHGTLRFAESANNNNNNSNSNSSNGGGGGIAGSSGSSDEIVQAKLMPFLDKIFSDGAPFCIVPTEYVFCYTMFFPYFLVCGVSLSLSLSYPSIAACLHSLTPHDV
jgi:hypothetical protein